MDSCQISFYSSKKNRDFCKKINLIIKNSNFSLILKIYFNFKSNISQQESISEGIPSIKHWQNPASNEKMSNNWHCPASQPQPRQSNVLIHPDWSVSRENWSLRRQQQIFLHTNDVNGNFMSLFYLTQINSLCYQCDKSIN